MDVDGVKPVLDLVQGFKPDHQVNVIVTVGGEPLAVRMADAKATGKSLNKGEKSAIVRDLKAAQAPTITRAKALGAKVRETFQASYNGFSVRIAADKVAALRALPGVTDVSAVRKVERSNERSVPLIGAPLAWEDTGFTGAGISIGVIDTGIDYYHANLGGAGNPADFAADDGLSADDDFPTTKVAGGYDFVGDAYDADTPVPDDDPLDCHGHGSHVAGTAGGQGVLSDGTAYTGPYDTDTVPGNSWNVGPGVAPEATLYAYRVFGCDGSANDDVIIAALDMAVTDGVDVVNMSLGSPLGQPNDPSVVASNNTALAGVMVVTSAGNEGPSAYMTGGPGIADRAMSTAAMDGGFAVVPTATIDIPGTGTLPNNNAGGPLPVTADLLVLPDGGGGISLGCDNAEYAGAAGKIVVTLRGTCARVDRAIFGQNNGAVAVIMINNAAGPPPFEGPIPGVTIPFLGANGGTGGLFLAEDGNEHTITPGPDSPSPTYLHLASFSSAGPRFGDSAPKPDVTAPGVSVFSTAIGTGTGAAALSGTSMASPHSAGVAALVRQAHPSWTPAQVKAAIMGTATTSLLLSAADQNVRRAGAGVVQPRKAVDTKLYATTGPGTSSLAYGAPALDNSYDQGRTITFWNTGTSAVTLNLANSNQGNLGATFSFSNNPVTVPAGGSATSSFKISLTRAAVAALPDAEASNFGALQTIRGAVVATPASAGAGLYPLRVPYIVAPRGKSNVSPTASTLAFGSHSTKDLHIKNSGIHNGFADFYAWGNSSPNSGLGMADLRADGVQALPGAALGGAASDRAIIFAANMYGQWSNPSAVELDILIDNDFDDEADYFVIGFDFGAITAGAFDGRYVAFTFDADFNLIDAWVADAPMNTSTMLLPALASEIGIASGSPRFQYTMAAFSLVAPGADFDSTVASFNAYSQPISTGDYFGMPPGANGKVPLSINRTSLAADPQRGWLVQSMDDQSGASQADLVNLQYSH